MGSDVKPLSGVDGIAGFLQNRLLATDTVVTNGKGAFSHSLAEYTMAAVLHFNKKVITRGEGEQGRFGSSDAQTLRLSNFEPILYAL